MKRIFAIALILIIFAGCSTVFAEDNTTQTVTAEDSTSLKQSDEINCLADDSFDDEWIDGYFDDPYSYEDEDDDDEIENSGINLDFSYTGKSISDKLIVKVSDSKTNLPISNLKVELMFEPTSYGVDESYSPTLTTDANGIVKCELIYPGKNYVYVKISDKGHTYYNPEPVYTIYVNKLNIDMKAAKFTTLSNSNDRYEVMVLNSNTKMPVRNVRVDLDVYSGNNAKKYYGVTNANGIAYFSTKSLSTGTHKVVVSSFSRKYNFNPITTSITVVKSAKLTLKAVNVKKSANKLVLKATLKTGKTPLKSNKITFKFNGKKYTAKTDKRGVAKLIIKKSVLKKLKAGKTVTYQASYGNVLVKKTATVKK